MIGMKVERDVSRAEWQRIVDGCEGTTFFHTPACYEAMSSLHPGGRIEAIRFDFEDGRAALMPCYSFRGRMRFEHLLSGPAWCYGGWFGSDGLDPAHQRAIMKWVGRVAAAFKMRSNPFVSAIEVPAGWRHAPDTTEILNLDQTGSPDDLLSNYKHSVRKQINKAARSGVTVRRAGSWADWESYFDVYERRLAQWGDKATAALPLSLFREIHRWGGKDAVLWVAEIEGRVVGGNLNFRHRGHVVEWHAAYSQDSQKYGVRNYGVHQILVDALKNGVAVYDFNPSGGHEGARTFKRTFGTASLPAPFVTRVSRRLVFTRRAMGVVSRWKGRSSLEV